MKTYASREAKNHFGSMLDDVQREPVTITRQGRPVAIVIAPEQYKIKDNVRARLAKSVEILRQEAENNGLTEDALAEILNE